MRYYEKSYSYEIAPGTSIANVYWQAYNEGVIIGQASNTINASTSGILTTPCHASFKVYKRMNPTVILYSRDGTANAINAGGATKRTGCTAVASSKNIPMYYISIDNSSTTSITDRTQIEYHYTAVAEL